MIMKNAYIFSSVPDISELEFSELKNHLWSEMYPAFYSSRVAVCGVADQGIFVRKKMK